MHLLFTALGSYGDVLPMVGLAQAMIGRGHQATVLANPYFQPIIEASGVGHVSLGTAEMYLELTKSPDLWHPVRGPISVMRSTCDYLPELYRAVDEHAVPGETLLVAHCLDFASRTHQDKHGTAVASVHFAPICLQSAHQSPQMFGMLMQDWVPSWLRRAQFWLANRLCDRLLGPSVNALRHELGLQPVRDIMNQWVFSPQLILSLFPDWFAPLQPDWPAQTTATGFPLWDQATDEHLPAEVEDFLKAGEPPLVFAPGSAMTEGREFFEAAVDACGRLGRRGILCTKYREQLPEPLPEGIRCFGFVPFSQLLPRAAALVHHGGIGTCGQGLAAGLPQLVMPMAYDQLDNATRLQRLGVAKIVRRKRFRGPKVASLLGELLGDEQVKQRASDCASQMDGRRSLEASCEALARVAD